MKTDTAANKTKRCPMDNFDEVKCCPSCEKPNQFGEECASCAGYFNEDAMWEQHVHDQAVARAALKLAQEAR